MGGPNRSRLVAAGVLGAAILAFALRALGFENVFPDEQSVALALADANYHARRAYWMLQNFPQVQSFDAYLNYPAGARVPWPPLSDWSARSFGALDPTETQRIVIPASLALTLGLQVVLCSFFLSVLGLRRRGSEFED